MKKFENKVFAINFRKFAQEPQSESLVEVFSTREMSLSELLIQELKNTPNKEFMDASNNFDIEKMGARLDLLKILKDVKPKDTVELENSSFDLLLKLGDSFAPGFLSEGLYEAKKYMLKLKETVEVAPLKKK